MAKYNLTIATDNAEELVKFLTPVLLKAVTGIEIGECASVETPVAEAVGATEEAPKAKRGRKSKAETVVENAPTPEAPETVDDLVDASKTVRDELEVADTPVTKQQVTDAAVEVGAKHGRDIMVSAITQYTETGKLAGVSESDYAALLADLKKLVTFTDKSEAKAYLAGV